MRTPLINHFKSYFKSASGWFLKTPERALDEAYEAAQSIKAIEDNHFNGNKISPLSGQYGASVQSYFDGELKKYLNIIKVRLYEFRTSRTVLQISNNQRITEIQLDETSPDWHTIDVVDKPAIILRKLRFIDEILGRYGQTDSSSPAIAVVRNRDTANDPSNGSRSPQAIVKTEVETPSGERRIDLVRADSKTEDIESIVDKTGVLPRSILKTVDRIKRELDPKAEQEVVDNFRSSKARTVISLRLILLLIIVPLLTQQLSKIVLVGPIVDRLREPERTEIFLNEELEEEAFAELRMFEERLKFETLIGISEPLTNEEIEQRVAEKATEIAEDYHQHGNDSIKNVFSDIISVLAFAGLIVVSKREIGVLKSFIDELIYGLSDSAKAFIIILLTDTFVGFHSPHGWEVLLEGVSRHLGLPANRDFIFLFIATFPVILDTIFKYWIFRYLNRISPSAVATYRNMNE